MMKMKYISCSDLRAADIVSVACCESCHDDHESHGYELFTLAGDEEHGFHSEVCCAVGSVVVMDEDKWKKLRV